MPGKKIKKAFKKQAKPAKKAAVKKTVRKAVVKKLVKKVAAKAKAKKIARKSSLKSVLAVQPQERMITLAELFREEVPAKNEERVSLASIVEESISDMKKEDSEISLADLFEDVDAEEEPAKAAETITLADLFENFDWDRVLEETKVAANQEAHVAEAAAAEAPTSSMFHSVAIPHFWRRPKAEPGVLARIFNPQMLATVGITMVSLFFVSLWFKATKASVTETVSKSQEMQQAWESVKQGYEAIQTQKQTVQNSINQLGTAVTEQQKMQDAQNAVGDLFKKAIEQKLQSSTAK